MTREQRLVAEAKMRRKDREEGRIPAAFIDEGLALFTKRTISWKKQCPYEDEEKIHLGWMILSWMKRKW
jgi:hypothetical protein